MIILVLEYLQLSPFMKLFRGSSVVDGIVQGHQVELLRLLISGTNKEIKSGACGKKYVLQNNATMSDYYWKSRRGKNNLGNNTAHFAFEIEDEALRYEVLEVLIREEVGDIDKPNIKGLEPYEIEHD